MSSERPSKEDSTRDKITRSFGKLSRLWRPPVSSPMNVNSVPDNYIAETDAWTHRSANIAQEYRSTLQTSIETIATPRPHMPFPPLSVGGTRVPLVGVDHSLATEVVHAEALKSAPPVSVSVTASMSTMQIQSRLETSAFPSD